MIQIQNLSKSYGQQQLFQDVTFNIHPKEKIGVLGRNGYGKSTLFRILLDIEQPEIGEILFPNNYTVGALNQHISFSENTILKEACLGLKTEEKEETWKAKKMLSGLGFVETDFNRSPDEFSGGYQLRIQLIKALLAQPDLLLLDEPTNYLDILSIRWLEKFLQRWQGELLVISHDQDFLDAVTNQKLVIHRKRIRKLKGNVKEVWQQIQDEEEVHEKSRQNQEKEKERQGEFIRTFRAGARSAGLVQSRIKMLEKLQPKEKLDSVPPISFSFRYANVHKNVLLEAEEVSFGYDDVETQNLASLLINNFSLTIYKNDCIGIIGKNGKGKSTLLKLLSEELISNSGEIRKGINTEIGYFGQTNVQSLHAENTILHELRESVQDVNEQEIRTLCGSLLFQGDAVHKKISVISGGEKSRVSLGKIFLRPVNLLLLDEPTNHLDMESCDALLESIKNFPGAVIIVSHNEKILREVTNRVIIFDAGGIRLHEKNYADFLDEIGWSEEEKEQKEQRVQKGKEIYEQKKKREKELRKLKKDMEKTEENISELENSQKDITENLQRACEEGDNEQIQNLGNQAKEISQNLEKLYEDLEKMMEREEEIVELS